MKTILDWNNWCNVFQNIEYFRPLIEQIFSKEKLEVINKISNLTPGTNAVFRVNNYVIKIFVPDNVKPWKEDDFTNERENVILANRLGINTPKLIKEGYIKTDYRWNYMIFEYLNAKDAKDVIPGFTDKEKKEFSLKIKDIVNAFNIEPKINIDNKFIKDRIINGDRWEGLKQNVKNELDNYVSSLKLKDNVHVHGDITKENIMIDNNSNVYVIDFADSVIAPLYYEYSPIVFDLFGYDKLMIHTFFGNKNDDEIVEVLFKSILLHDFGGDFATDLLCEFCDKSLKDINKLDEIKTALKVMLMKNIR